MLTRQRTLPTCIYSLAMATRNAHTVFEADSSQGSTNLGSKAGGFVSKADPQGAGVSRNPQAISTSLPPASAATPNVRVGPTTQLSGLTDFSTSGSASARTPHSAAAPGMEIVTKLGATRSTHGSAGAVLAELQQQLSALRREVDELKRHQAARGT